MKKLVSIMVLVVLALTALVPAALAAKGAVLPSGEYDEPRTMYVYTENGGTLNVRSEPRVDKKNLIGELNYGAKVTVIGFVVINPDWLVIRYSKGPDGVGYVMARYLQDTPPKSKEQKDKEEKLRNLEELNRQMASYKPLEQSLMIQVRAPRTSGTINFRVGPGVAAERIGPLPDGREMTAVGETTKWYQAIDSASGKLGYVSKNYVNVLGPVVAQEPEEETKVETLEKESLGKLTVNGDFALQCKLPEGYHLQVVNVKNTKVVASVLPDDNVRPIMYLTIAYSEPYSGVERLNDLPGEDLALLEKSFTEESSVTISYRETGYGTKLMVVQQTGDDQEYVNIFTIYKGYQIEFMMTPNNEAPTTDLTEEQIKMCVDFLTEVDFVEL